MRRPAAPPGILLLPALACLICPATGQAVSPAPLPASAVTGAAAQRTAPSARVCLPDADVTGTLDDTAALQRALDDCAASPSRPGGTVQLGAGRYLSGPLTLRGGETLNLAAGAVLLGTTDMAAYRGADGGMRPLLGASGADDLGLTGAGTIDGQGQAWWAAVRAARAAGQPEPRRPRLIALDRVRRVLVQGLTLTNSPSFHLVPSHAQDVTVSGVTVRAPADSPNTDGIDPADARNVTIRDSTFDTGDDDIAIKAGTADPQHPGAASGNILIERCSFLHGHGLSIGSETNGGVTGVLGRDLSFTGTDAGLRIKTLRGRGGVVDDVQFARVRMVGVKVALSIAAYYPKVPATDAAQPITDGTPDLRRVAVSDLTASGPAQQGVIAGLPERPAGEVTLTRVRMTGGRRLLVRDAVLRLVDSEVDVVTGAGGQVVR